MHLLVDSCTCPDWEVNPQPCCVETALTNRATQPGLMLDLNLPYLELSIILFFLKILFIYFRQREKEGEREGGKHQCVVASCVPLTGDLAYNPGKCPDWESNQQPFGSQAGTQSTVPYQPVELNFGF